MEVWNILNDDEAQHFNHAEFKQQGVNVVHPITFRPYMFFKHKEQKQYVLVPMKVADITDVEDTQSTE